MLAKDGPWGGIDNDKDIVLTVGDGPTMSIDAPLPPSYPEKLNAIMDERARARNVFVTRCLLPQLGEILPLLPDFAARKHVRFYTVPEDGMPAAEYLAVLEELKKIGVTSVSFYACLRL